MPMPARRAMRMSNQRFDFMRINIRAGDRRHPETLSYRCCLSTLAGFGRLCRAGPARTLARIIEVTRDVNAMELLASLRTCVKQSFAKMSCLLIDIGFT